MKKLKLNVDAVKVETFDVGAPTFRTGTVAAAGKTGSVCKPDPRQVQAPTNSCDDTCVAVETCGVEETCLLANTCQPLGASCPNTCVAAETCVAAATCVGDPTCMGADTCAGVVSCVNTCFSTCPEDFSCAVSCTCEACR